MKTRKRVLTDLRGQLTRYQLQEYPGYCRVSGIGQLVMRVGESFYGDPKFTVEISRDGIDPKIEDFPTIVEAQARFDALTKQWLETPIVWRRNRRGFKMRGWVEDKPDGA